MKTSFNVCCKPSFGSVIPIKKIILKDDEDYTGYKQMTLDCFEFQNNDEVDDSCSHDLSKKVIQALNRILLKNDEAEKNTFENARNNMIRMSLAHMDKDYKIPPSPVDSSHNEIIKPAYSRDRNYLLTGDEARGYALSGRNIGGARVLVRDHGASYSRIDDSKRDFGYYKEDVLTDYNARLRNQNGSRMGMVIYADVDEVPRKGHKGMRSEIKIKGIDFEPV